MVTEHAFFFWSAAGAAAAVALLVKLKSRLELSKAKHRSFAGHPRIAKRIASLIPFYEFEDEHFFCSDHPPEEVAARRRAGFARLSEVFRERFAKTRALTADVKESI